MSLQVQVAARVRKLCWAEGASPMAAISTEGTHTSLGIGTLIVGYQFSGGLLEPLVLFTSPVSIALQRSGGGLPKTPRLR
jgi:hypothetical protein